ncbi:MAG TPA: hypothetical protein PKA55_03225 [Rhodoblastus sp.]|nr:hypothetical protein [Rhodoblastus sp.]
MTHDEAVARLIAELDRAERARSSHAGEAPHAQRAAFRAWQAGRLARTHADLLASPRFGPAAAFFLTDLYGPQDISVQTAQVRRIVPLMSRTLPATALDTVADAIELDALSEELDAAMIAELGGTAEALTAPSYAAAYRVIARQAERGRQIDLIEHLGRSLDGLTRQPFIGAALKMMRKPAEIAGLGALQSFLERGYAAFRVMRGGGEFVDIVARREREISNALFAGDDAVLERPGAP